MFGSALLSVGALLGFLAPSANALGSSCSAPLTKGSAGPNDTFWLQNMKHQGIAAYNTNATAYKVFRNVMDYGAKGDGVTDDTKAINAAIQDGNRCAGDLVHCDSTTITPAIVYFPTGTYKLSTPLIAYYQTQLIGDARHPPTLLSAPNFNGIALIDADPYLGDNWNWYPNTDSFFRSMRNFVFDLRPATGSVLGIHWQVSQATSLMNIVFEMSTAAGNQQQGLLIENGSGGFLGDLVFNGGKVGASLGNQQFTFRNLTFNNPVTAVTFPWNWGLTLQGITINNAQVGFDASLGDTCREHDGCGQGVEALAIIDAVVTNTPIFLRLSRQPVGTLQGSFILNNVKLTNVPTAVGVLNGPVLFPGGTKTIDTWAMGNVYNGADGNPTFALGIIPPIKKAPSLLDASGRIFQKSHPQYIDYAASDFVSVRDQGAKGDGKSDDTAAIQAIFDKFAGCKIIFFDAGTYLVHDTIKIPAGVQVAGEAWSVIAGTGSAFHDYNNPKVVIEVGKAGDKGVAEFTDMIFTTNQAAAGAIIVEWNVHDPEGQPGAAGVWDTHLLIGGQAGSGFQVGQCPTTGAAAFEPCITDYLAFHLTAQSSAYLEGMWIWLADHDLDGDGQVTLFSGHGLLSESQGPVWMIGTASEHHVEYQYFLRNAANHYIGLAQTETPYYQPNPAPMAPFVSNKAYDPKQEASLNAWAFTVENSKNILVFGAGFYSFFSNYDGTTCVLAANCQKQIVNIDNASDVAIYSLNTVDVTYMLSVNGQGVVNREDNNNGFSDTMTAWRSVVDSGVCTN